MGERRTPSGAERLNEEGFAAFAARAEDEGPVVMLNLLRFAPDGGRERYAEYGAAVAPLLEGVGARSSSPARPLRPSWERSRGTWCWLSSTRAGGRSSG